MSGINKRIATTGYHAVAGIEVEIEARPSRDGVQLVASLPVEDMNSPYFGHVMTEALGWDEITDDTDWRLLADRHAAEFVRHCVKVVA